MLADIVEAMSDAYGVAASDIMAAVQKELDEPTRDMTEILPQTVQ